MPEAVSAYISECLDEISKAAAEPWLKSLKQEPFTGWKAAPMGHSGATPIHAHILNDGEG